MRGAKPSRRGSLVGGVTVALALGLPAWAHGQAAQRSYLDELGVGLEVPGTARAGHHDALAIGANPAGLAWAAGGELLLVGDFATVDDGHAGGGVGGFAHLGRGVGVAVEHLTPPRSQDVDAGTPTRVTLAQAMRLGRRVAIGTAWRHWFDDGPLGGKDSLDVGVAGRIGNHLAFGVVARDVFAPTAGDLRLDRRYEVEIATRPTGSERVELGLGGRLREVDSGVGLWARGRGRVARGVFAALQVETGTHRVIDRTPIEVRMSTVRELRLGLSLEVSFGARGVTAFARSQHAAAGNALASTGAVVRWSVDGPTSVVPTPARLERVSLTGAMPDHEVSAWVWRLRRLVRAADVRGVVVSIDQVGCGWAGANELRRALTDLRAAGVPVFVYLMAASSKDYFIASAATRIYVDPVGSLDLTGLGSTQLHFRGALDLVGITPEFERIAEFKSAPEQFTEAAPTAVATAQRAAIYDELWAEYVAQVAAGRQIAPGEVHRLVAAGPYSAAALRTQPGLVDAVATPDEVAQAIALELGGAVPVRAAARARDRQWQTPHIAVLRIDGEIMGGASRRAPLFGRSIAGVRTLIGSFEAALADPQVRAIVVRVDSPGGSAIASDLLARTLMAARGGAKPILCSFGDVAASGGYYLAAGCDAIFADAMSVTGSIGIFTGKFDLSGLLARAGVGVTSIERGGRALMMSSMRPWSDDERQAVRAQLTALYDRFVATVAQGRGLSEASVRARGDGRVFTGRQAQALRLVDHVGGLADAIDFAARRAGLDPDGEMALRMVPVVRRSWLELALGLAGVGQVDAVADADGLAPLLDALRREAPAVLLYPDGEALTRLPFDVP